MSIIGYLLGPFVAEQFGPTVENTEERLEAFKRLCPAALPADYEDLLRNFSRCVDLRENHILAIDPPKPRQEGVFTCIGLNPPVNYLYGLQDNHYGVFRGISDFSDQIPPGLIAIGCDIMDNQICMDIAGPAPYTIWHWFHEGEDSVDADGNPGYANMFRLAYDFTDLLRRLRHGPYIDPAEPPARPVTPGESRICYISPETEEYIRKLKEDRERDAADRRDT